MDRPEILGHAFNLSTGNGIAVTDLVNKILEVMGRKDLEPVILNQAKAEIHDQTLSSEKAGRLLNWKPVYTIDEGLAETVAWYKNHFATKGTTSTPRSSDALLS
jgi:CDP-glucose 4,6-dehydratase